MTDSITKTVFLKAPKETVWAFLTEKDKLARWFHAAEEDLADGQGYALLGNSDEGGPVRVCWGTPPTRLVYSFTVKPLNGALTTVTWTLDEIDGGTRLTLLHEGVGVAGDATFGMLMSLDKGWDEHFGRLRGVAST